jgi:eukaryotic-like serine/threonine-protein kinase
MEDRQKIKELFHEALDVPLSERADFLAANCRDEETRNEVENLLKFHDAAGDFIVAPAVIESGAVGEIFGEETENRIGEKIGHYEIVREIGRGGMGAVYLAIRADDEFRQEVALKIVKRGMDTDFIVNRFRNERQILAGLNHPNIARLLEGGTTDDGLPYFVMEYVDGKYLLTYCNEKNLALEERLNIFRRICAAVSYAHQNLIVHRDLKPSNILISDDGTPKLLDFGIAKLLNENNFDKTTGVMRLLTPEYASPEQIRGESISTASDVYSLGVILYQLLTGQSPYQTTSKSYEEIVDSVCQTEPPLPSNIWRDAETRRRGDTENNRQVSTKIAASPTHRVAASQLKGDLDNIILKALQIPCRNFPKTFVVIRSVCPLRRRLILIATAPRNSSNAIAPEFLPDF